MANNIKHSLVLTVYNAPHDVTLCLQSIKKSLDFSCAELVIVDDASKEETQKILDDFAAENSAVLLVRHKENQGYLFTVNHGIEYTHGDVITLLNSDTYIPEDFSSRILACFAEDESIGIASPVLAHGNPFSVPITCNINPKISNGSLPLLVASMNEKAKKSIPQYPDIIFPDGACFSIRRQCIEAIGSFNEAYQPGYFEELDFCMRARQKGFRSVHIDNLYVYHKAHASFGQKKRNEHMKKNEKRFFQDWDAEYRELIRKFPKKQHKKRIFCMFYPYWQYVLVESILLFSRIIPCRSARRRIRQLYQ